MMNTYGSVFLLIESGIWIPRFWPFPFHPLRKTLAPLNICLIAHPMPLSSPVSWCGTCPICSSIVMCPPLFLCDECVVHVLGNLDAAHHVHRAISHCPDDLPDLLGVGHHVCAF